MASEAEPIVDQEVVDQEVVDQEVVDQEVVDQEVIPEGEGVENGSTAEAVDVMEGDQAADVMVEDVVVEDAGEGDLPNKRKLDLEETDEPVTKRAATDSEVC
jgi:hypothetical protein